jgi:predicted nucleic acid-binding protein
MNIFLDTNVLVSAVIKQHVFHERSFAVFNSVLVRKNKGAISSHSLVEMYSVLTKLPPPYRHAPEQALLSIEENVLKHFELVSLRTGEYATFLREAVSNGIQGGMIYDALILKCAEAAHSDRIYTLNLKHFQSFAPPATVRKLSEP